MAEEKTFRNLTEIVNDMFGVNTAFRINPELTVVPANVEILLPGDPKRIAFVIVNLGNLNIYISPAHDVSAAAGILLVANGGLATSKFTEDLMLPSVPWYAISSGAGSAVYALEIIITS